MTICGAHVRFLPKAAVLTYINAPRGSLWVDLRGWMGRTVLKAAQPQDDDARTWLSDTPATAHDRRRSLTIMGVMLAVFLIAAPFAPVHLPGNNAFIPIVQTVLFFGDL